MYELNRVRMFGVGPRGARFTDVTLNLADVGEPIGGGTLFDAPPRRPSPYSLLLLENGGGKSVLLKLLFSVILPGKRNTLGGASDVLEKFVVGEDAGHVVLEWMHVKTGERIVTGKTYQWRRKRTSDGRKLGEAWWSLRPNPAVEVSTLPFTADGRRLRLGHFQEALEEIDRTHPATQLAWIGSHQGEWLDHLRSLRIEPELFAIQRQMNADEGEAASAFKFKSSKEFVDWLLTIVTDPADAVSVADNFDSYATTVGDRSAMLMERDFAEGAVAALHPVGAAHTKAMQASAGLQRTVQDIHAFSAQVAARHDAEQSAARRLTGEHAAAVTAASASETDRDRTRDVVNEIRRQTLALELAAAEEQQDAAQLAQAAVELELSGWAASEMVEARDQSVADATALERQIADAEETARPALAARDAAAAQLLAKLHNEAANDRAQARKLNQEAEECKEAAGKADERRTAALRDEEKARSAQQAALAKVDETARAVAQAISDGLMPAGLDVPAAALEARAKAALLKDALAATERKAAEVARELKDAQIRAREAAGALLDKEREQQPIAQQLHELTARASRLAADEMLVAALAVDRIDTETLDASAEALAGQLAEDIAARQERLDGLRSVQNGDHRVLTALGNGGLLPARPEVEAAVQVLQDSGVAAHTGWQYLAQNASASERITLIATHPELADGVVLVDATQLPQACTATQSANLLPAAAIAVGTGAQLLTATEPTSARFVIETNPAMFDEEAAEARRAELREDMKRRGQDIETLTTALNRTRDVAAELAAWRKACPSGRLTELTEQLLAADAAVATAQERAQAATTDMETWAEREAVYPAQLAQLRTQERAAADTAGALDRLTAKVERSAEAQRRAGEAEQAMETVRRTVGEATMAREQQLAKAEDAVRAAENARDRAERHLVAASEVVTASGAIAQTVPSQSLLALQQAYAAAADVYRSLEVGQDLRAEAERAMTEAARRRTDLERLPPETTAEAERLLTTPAGADRASRQAEIARAKRDKQRLAATINAANERIGQLRSDLRTASPADRDRNVWIVLPETRRPASVEQGRQLMETAQAEQRAAQDALEIATRHAADLQRHMQQANEAARSFREVLQPVQATLDDTSSPQEGRPTTELGPDTVEPYQQSAESAREKSDQLRRELREARAAASDATRALSGLVDGAVRFVSDVRFEKTTNVARRAIISLGREQLGARATEFADQLAQRLATLNTDLDNAGKHRKLIVERLAALTDGALKTLRTATRLSRLPSGLGDWEGKEFLRIRFTDPDPSLLAARIGELVDDIAASTAARQIGPRGSAPKRDGIALLLRSAEAAVPKGFTVEVLKPDSVLRDERVPVEQMNTVFSGGQELTAAIILYCTMAALRANERGQMRNRHSGVLFLDNPIGKASASYLLDLQQGVASALGVQLVYTTGLSDDRALAAFPLWIRMRNDADLRAGLKHIRVAETVRAQMPHPFADFEAATPGAAPGTVTAARVYRRPTEAP
ncbi:hypothetical protein [Streptomyces sp. PR69]|uniref:hypothetical protein n=1 Tax=Streptomyces sp. PR69 TaxID=2984950 RepID=UPI0022643306|nr:hypothetical protein [Streptomyces sp. PR69]